MVFQATLWVIGVTAVALLLVTFGVLPGPT
jgi:hypothetical protein